jgi:biofilm PGA synthesis lipoprotein PgaB
MYCFIWIFLFFASLSDGTSGTASGFNNTFITIAYHDVVATAAQADSDAVTKGDLVAHFQWLKQNGYHPIHPGDLFKAQSGEKSLPDKAVLLTFDDGYANFYDVVYPLLKAFNFPAVAGIVGSWIDAKEQHKEILYGSKTTTAENFMTWQQVKEVSDSGLVEIASHTFKLHNAITANPQGTTQPALVTRLYDLKNGAYESLDAYKARIRKDLKTNNDRIFSKIGKKVRVIVWPYGRYNQISMDIAKSLGIKILITLDSDNYLNTTRDFDSVDRYYYTPDQTFANYVSTLENAAKEKTNALRAVRVDLDKIYDPDPQQIEKNLGKLIDRLYTYQISAVFLQAFVDTEAKGYAESLYFYNRHLPVKSDIFNRIAWQIVTRTNTKVYAWLPIMAFDFKNDDYLVKRFDPQTKTLSVDPQQYVRSSPFHPIARQKIIEIYEDLAFNAPINGIMFHDDILTDFEDFSPAGVKAMEKEGFPGSYMTIKENPSLFSQWTRWKSKALIDFTQEIIQKVKVFRPTIKVARSIFSMPILKPESEAWFGQNYQDFLNAYDYTALMAMPYMEKESNASAWLDTLSSKVKENSLGLKKTLFELQTVDWADHNAPIDSRIILEQMRDLSAKGVLHFSLYPDDIFKNHPEINIIKEGISLQRYPYLP